MELSPDHSLTTGYEHLVQPLAGRADVELAGRTIAFDANVLLALYRRHFASAENILEELRRIQGRLFLPAQAQSEFWLNRESVLHMVRDANMARELNDAEKAVKRVIDAAARWDIDEVEQGRLKDLTDQAFQQIRNATAGRSTTHRATQALVDPASDVIVERLELLFAGRTGRPYSATELEQRCADADVRFTRRRPPGYMDAGKPNGGYGDYLLWCELLDRSEEQGRPIILVTNDVKEDWWRLLDGKTPLGARHELIDEMRARAGVTFATVTFEDFLTALSKDPGSGIEESAVDDSGEVITNELEDGAHETWTITEFSTLMKRLTELGYGHRANVVLSAAARPDGVLPRSEVLSLLQLPADAKLTGFTRAIRWSQNDLAERGLIRPGLPWALRAQYDGPGKARRFAVPLEIAQAFARGLAGPGPLPDA